MPGNAARVAWNAAERLMAMIASHFRREILDAGDELDAGVVDQDVDAAEVMLGALRPSRRSRPACSCRRA